MTQQLETSKQTPDSQGRDEGAGREIRKAIVPGLLALYLNLSLLAWGWVLLDISTGSLNVLRWLGIVLPENPEYVALLKLAFYAAVGGAAGGIVFGMQNLWKHATAGDFELMYAGDYLFRQFGAAALAVVVFALIRGGILTALGTDPTAATATAASAFSSFAIGFLSGFGSYQVVGKLDELIKEAFGKSSTQDQESSRKGEVEGEHRR